MADYTIRTTANGRAIERVVNEIVSKTVKVGFQDGTPVESEDGEDEGVDICDIATWNEFGTETMPSRPFMRDSIDNHPDKVKGIFEHAVSSIMSGSDAQTVLSTIGIAVKDLMQMEIRDGDFEPNAPSTIAKKGSSHPLIDTGRMRQSVNYIITDRS